LQAAGEKEEEKSREGPVGSTTPAAKIKKKKSDRPKKLSTL
jgi:hypothetical protein